MPSSRQIAFFTFCCLSVAVSVRASDVPQLVSLAELCSSACTTECTVRTQGIVVDAFADEVDADNAFLLIKDREFALPVAVHRKTLPRARQLIDCLVAVTGGYHPMLAGGGARKFAGPFITADGDSAISVLENAPADPYAVPTLETFKANSPQQIARLGKRKIGGKVLAVWDGRLAMVRGPDERVTKVEFSANASLPAPGQHVTVVGHPATDQFRINLRRCLWKPAATPDALDEPEDVSPRQLTTVSGTQALNVNYYGRCIRLTGIVRAVPAANDPHGRLYLESEGTVLAVNAGCVERPFADLLRGTTVSVTGVCLFDADDWHPLDVFPRLRELTLILRKDSDIRILSRPPWWRDGRLAWLVLGLLAVLAAILAWTVALKRLVAKRSRQLVREEVATVRAELRTNERTHLAIELHDALSQSLTGIALQTKAAARIAKRDLPAALRQLDIVQRSLGSCREELRNCLWDLRNDASGRGSIDEAVRVTLQPLTGETQVQIRFNLPRSPFSESTVSALLRIVRELVVNAIRHGKAKKVKVAGCLDGETVMFSVTDDGTGFDPAAAPGLDNGHFGLQGIRERLGKLHGKMEIESAPGQGTRVTVRFALPHADGDEEESR